MAIESPRHGKEAALWGRNQINNPSQSWYRLCLSFVRQCFGTPGVYPSAMSGWNNARHKHRTTNFDAVPAYVPYWFTNGTYGHVVLTLGGGLCLTNDYGGAGKITIARLANVAAWCGSPAGWTEDINGYRVWEKRKKRPKKPKFSVVAAQRAMRLDPWSGTKKSHVQGVATVRLLEKRIWNGDVPKGNTREYIGNIDQRQIMRVQRRHGWRATGVFSLRQIRRLNRTRNKRRRWDLVDVDHPYVDTKLRPREGGRLRGMRR